MAARGTFASRRDIVRVCRRLYACGLIAGPDGNVSVRVAPDRVLVTPAGMSKVDVEGEDLVEISMEGRHLRGRLRASSEVEMHLRIYSRRPDVRAVVHAHPPTATGFAVAGESFEASVLPEMIVQMGAVPLLPYATPGTAAVADGFDPFIAQHDAFLMANHGATTIGESLTIAHQRMESLEHSARILMTARLLGRLNTLAPAEVEALLEARQRARPGTTSPEHPQPSATHTRQTRAAHEERHDEF